MADVRVNIKGDSSKLNSEVDKAKRKIRGLGDEAKKASKKTKTGFLESVKSLNLMNPAVASISAGLGALAVTARNTFKVFADEAARSARAVNTALGTIKFDVGDTPDLRLTNRDDIVALGRDAAERVNQINSQLDQRGLLVRLQQNDTVLQGVANTASNIVGLFSDQFRASQGNTEELLRQRQEQQAIVDATKQQLANIEAIRRLRGQATGAGADDVPTFSFAADAPRSAGPISFLNQGNLFDREDPNRFSVGALPDAPVKQFNDDIADATLEIINFDRAVNAGLIGGIDAAQERVGLLTDRLRVMVEAGVSPASVGFQELQGDLQVAQMELEGMQSVLQGNAIAFNIFSDVAGQAIDSIIFKVDSLKDTLRGVGRQLLSTFIRAGVNVGIGALTGNPISFGSALGSLVGVGGAATGATGLDAAIAPAQVNALAGGSAQKLEVTALRVSGGDLLLGLQEAQGKRGSGGIDIS